MNDHRDPPTLPARLEPPAHLEERTVARLRAEGLLAPSRADLPGRRVARGWAIAAVAAGVALFGGGFVLGDVRGGQRTLDVVEALAGADAQRTAALVQRTGSAYVAALAALAEADTVDSAVGREVARAVLWSAAAELARLDPDDADLWRILQSLDPTADVDPGSAGADGADTPAARTVLWF